MTVPTQIGIHAPYTWGETTSMAITVAEMAVRLGLRISFLPTNVHNGPVHSRWDKYILSRHDDFRIWSHDCSHVVWFDVHRCKLLEAKSRGTKHILVLLWHRLQPGDVQSLPLFDHVICPHARAAEAMAEVIPANYVVAPWDPGNPLVVDTPPRYGGNRLLVVLDSYSAVTAGHFLLHTIHTMLDALPELSVTLWHEKRWTNAGHKAYEELIEQYGSQRLYVLRKATDVQRAQAYATHDWVFYPAVRDNASLPLLEGLYAGRPGIAFGSLPQTEVIKQQYNGMLIPCENEETQFGAYTAQVNRHLLGDELYKILADKQLYTTLSSDSDWSPELTARRLNFQRVWRRVWDCS